MKQADHQFRAIYDRHVKWQAGAATKLLTLPSGVKVKIFAHDPVMKRIDMKVKFPRGYVEPAHTHDIPGHTQHLHHRHADWIRSLLSPLGEDAELGHVGAAARPADQVARGIEGVGHPEDDDRVRESVETRESGG